MTCSCEFSVWMRDWLASFGTEAPYVLAALLLIWWARKSIRREHFGAMAVRKAILLQAPAAALFTLGALILLGAMFMR